MRKVSRITIVAALALTMSLSACSTKSSSSGTAKTGTGGVKTDYGVTDSTINLGVLVDESGVFKVTGLAQAEGNQIWANDINASGGICGRQIKLDVKDDGYSADKAVTLYASMKNDVVGMLQLLGSPIVAALRSQIDADNMLSVPTSWATGNLSSKAILQVGATYAIEMINALAYVQKKGLIQDKDKLGIIYIKGEYGGDGLLGAKQFTSEHGQNLVEVPIAGTDEDMSAAVTQLKSQNVKAVLVTTTPSQTGSVATQMKAQGIGDLPIVGVNPTFAPTLLNTPAKDALGNLYRGHFVAPMSADIPIIKKISKEFAAKYTDPIQDGVNVGYVSGLAYAAVLKQACKDKDMTRLGVLTASRKVKVDTEGLTAPLDYSNQGQPATRATYVEQVDASLPGGVKIVGQLNASKEAKDMTIPPK
ncbi:MAG: ABC transporter substrate-binding protein [Antricoccus sp.]